MRRSAPTLSTDSWISPSVLTIYRRQMGYLRPCGGLLHEENAGHGKERDDGTAQKAAPDAARQRLDGGEPPCGQGRSPCRHQCHEQRNSSCTGDLLNGADDSATVRVEAWLHRWPAHGKSGRHQASKAGT